jgi:hypothetical protein
MKMISHNEFTRPQLHSNMHWGHSGILKYRWQSIQAFITGFYNYKFC